MSKKFHLRRDDKPAHRHQKKHYEEDIETMTEQEANELVFGDFAEEIELYGLTDIGNK